MCFKVYSYLITGADPIYDIVYDGVRVFGKTGEDNFDFFLDSMRKLGGMDDFAVLASQLKKDLTKANWEFLERSYYGISFYGKRTNTDLVDETGYLIFRGEGGMMRYFLDIESIRGTRVWEAWIEQFWDRLDAVSSDVFEEAAEKLRALSIRVEKSDYGMSPDFSLTPEHLYKDAAGRTYGNIKIKLTGSRSEDYRMAFEAAGLNPAEAAGYTWHHLDDFNTETGSCTMQLVKTVIHSQVEHTGGVRMWELLYGGATGAVKYAP